MIVIHGGHDCGRLTAVRAHRFALPVRRVSRRAPSARQDAQVVLFTYLLILAQVCWRSKCAATGRAAHPISFLLSQFYFWGWYSEFYRPAKLERTIIFATLFFLLYAVLPVLRAVPVFAIARARYRGGPGELFRVPRRSLRHAVAAGPLAAHVLVLALPEDIFWFARLVPHPKPANRR